MSKQNEKETHSARRDEEILIARQTLRGGTECYLLLSREETRIDFLYIQPIQVKWQAARSSADV
jgi:hypothetical protein